MSRIKALVEGSVGKLLRILRALPEMLKARLYLSVFAVVLLPVLDLLMAYALFLLLLLLQGEPVMLAGLSITQNKAGTVVAAFILLTVLRQVNEFWSLNLQRKLTQDIYAIYSVRLLQKYMSLPWLQFKTETKAARIKHCTVTTLDGAYSFQVALNLLAALVTLLLLGLTTFLKAPMLALAALALLLLFAFSSKRYIKARLQKAVHDHEYYQRKYYHKVHESLSLPREIQVFQSTAYFSGIVQKELDKLSKAKVDLSLLPHIPRISLELILTLAIALGIWAVTFMQNYNAQELIANLAVIAVLARRIIPAMAAFLAAYTELDGAVININVLEQELNQKSVDSTLHTTTELDREILMRVDNISFGYESGAEVLKDMMLDIRKGDRIALLGSTGRGKSTLMMIVAGIVSPLKGTVYAASILSENSPGIAYVPQEVFVLSGSVLDNIVFGDNKVDEALAWEVVRFVALEEVVKSLPDGIYSEIGDNGARFSGGQRQRIGIARALYKQPKLLLLDEATSALDEGTELQVMKSISRFMKDGAVVFITHRRTTAEAQATRILDLV